MIFFTRKEVSHVNHASIPFHLGINGHKPHIEEGKKGGPAMAIIPAFGIVWG